jgi:hypothetical protein
MFGYAALRNERYTLPSILLSFSECVNRNIPFLQMDTSPNSQAPAHYTTAPLVSGCAALF